MNLAALLPSLAGLPDLQQVLQALPAPAQSLHLHPRRTAQVPFWAVLARESAHPLLIITHRNDRALTILEELEYWLPERTILHFAEPSALFYERNAWGVRTTRQRLQALQALLNAKRSAAQPTTQTHAPIIVTSARALMMRTLSAKNFFSASQWLRVGGVISIGKALQQWQSIGYQPASIVSEPGQFSRRGGILDIWSQTADEPIRIEFFGDEIESLRTFDPATQRSMEKRTEVMIPPAREALPGKAPAALPFLQNLWADAGLTPATDLQQDLEKLAQGIAFPELENYLAWLDSEPASLLDYLPSQSLVAVQDWQAFEEAVGELEAQALEMKAEQLREGLLPADVPTPYLSWSDLQEQLSQARLLTLGGSTSEPPAGLPDLSQTFFAAERWGGQIKSFLDHVAELAIGEQPTVIVTRQAARLSELWNEYNTYTAPQDVVTGLPQGGQPVFVQGALSEGWVVEIPSSLAGRVTRLHLLTDAEIFGWSRPEPRRRKVVVSAPPPEAAFIEFQPNDYVVHVEHGIGRYIGLVTRQYENMEREFLQVEYEGGDHVYVPISQADRLTRYIGADGSRPSLHRLSTQEWTRAREKAREAAQEVAAELLELYAKRETISGYAFGTDTPWMRELEASFPYSETEDQLRAINEVKVDMQRPRPMDRLICGDVGYGKTEVALRAAFKATLDGKQVAVLVPTTVLAQQHTTTFQQRLAAFPVKIETLSRFRSEEEQAQVLTALECGEVDIVIGTHRLLSKDVRFKELGLVIIDEEQRFGVTHKEYLKHLRTAVDVLTLTATPIPRTLYMSLTGVRDISVINTAPSERVPVITNVAPYNKRTIRQAILRELDRGGQVFYVHNRVGTIQGVLKILEDLVPEARIGVGHGQMEEDQLAKVMESFTHGELDVLLCTTIIESGIDIPNANTLIIERADLFGLSQLYQLRGRVGRSVNRAYAYFFYPAQGMGKMTEEARERLDTIAEQNQLGAGYQIAMRDLEMRGAGDVLGMRQSGHISAVGFHLYTRLLNQAVRLLKTQHAIVQGEMPNLPTNTPTSPSLIQETHTSLELALVAVELPLEIGIPPAYVGDAKLRVQLYRRMAELATEDEIATMETELQDRFGTLPPAVKNLLFQLRIKLAAYQAGVDGVGHEAGRITLRSRAWESDGAKRLLAQILPPSARVSKGKAWLYKSEIGTQWQDELMKTLQMLANHSVTN
ncbi:MAG TPA: transcription-repair coupling factor [Anaerolineales bacterium]|nr:transcription-repair coupling factor [Anaerolineales bacterium]